MIELMISVNELDLAKTKLSAPLRNNLTKEERRALQELKLNTNIVIKKADKGSAVVIMNRDDYIAESLRQLNDGKYYVKTDVDLTSEYSLKVNGKLDRMFQSKESGESALEYLCNTKARTARFYLLPKIHKSLINPLGRPIVSANERPTERTSQFVDFFLQPILLRLDSYLQDTTAFLNLLDKLGKLPPGCLLVALDIYKNTQEKASEDGGGRVPSEPSSKAFSRVFLYLSHDAFNNIQVKISRIDQLVRVVNAI